MPPERSHYFTHEIITLRDTSLSLTWIASGLSLPVWGKIYCSCWFFLCHVPYPISVPIHKFSVTHLMESLQGPSGHHSQPFMPRSEAPHSRNSPFCWNWASKCDSRASTPSLGVMLFSPVCIPLHFHSAVRIAPPHVYSFSFLLLSSITSCPVLLFCSVTSLFSLLRAPWRIYLFLHLFWRFIRLYFQGRYQIAPGYLSQREGDICAYPWWRTRGDVDHCCSAHHVSYGEGGVRQEWWQSFGLIWVWREFVLWEF